jgi:hypothetical protein
VRNHQRSSSNALESHHFRDRSASQRVRVILWSFAGGVQRHTEELPGFDCSRLKKNEPCTLFDGNVSTERHMSSQPALIVAHPGHELMVHGWVEETRPRVSILTDGSGRSGSSRIASSEEVVRVARADAGRVWGAVSDQDVYQGLLRGDAGMFVEFAVRLGDDLAELRPPYVAGDAREGFNPTHDICRMIIDAAVRRARRTGAEIGNYAFFLLAPHDRCPEHLRTTAILKTLSDEQLERKLAAALHIPSSRPKPK